MSEGKSPQVAGSHAGRELFFLGFATLFLELIFIRYLAANIWNLGFFPNLVLLSVFIGMAIGFIFHHHLSQARSDRLFSLAPLMTLGLIVFVHFAHPQVPGFGNQQGEVGGELFFTVSVKSLDETSLLPFIFCFLCITLIFFLIAQRTAKVFAQFRPLTAYTLDIAGSCSGIAGFILMSWFHLPAFIWYALFALIFAGALPRGSRQIRWIVWPSLAIVVMVFWQDHLLLAQPAYRGPLNVFWSPYQKIEFLQGVGLSLENQKKVFVNGLGHQQIFEEGTLRNSNYQKPHNSRAALGRPAYRSVLVLGAGTGNDVATALLNGAEHVDAVEIDPVLAQLGRMHNPLRPYQDPRVQLIVDDGRAFMNRTTRRYDLVIFALTDSLVKISAVSQLRLENYLFTAESIRKAYTLLSDQGDIFLYNHYREPWLIEKLQNMLLTSTQHPSRTIFNDGQFAIMTISKLDPAAQETVPPALLQNIPTDDWPFLYLKERGIPPLYARGILFMMAFVGLILVLLQFTSRNTLGHRKSELFFLKLAFVFMGVAFLLLETKSIIQFSLLFGTTWLNSSLVFLAILLLVLAANWVAQLLPSRSGLGLIYVLLLISSLGTLFYPLGRLLEVENTSLRFLLASLMTFSPIFFANLLFSLAFREQKSAEHLFGWNLLGATVGGVVEYCSMAIGYDSLAMIVAGCYTLTFLFLFLARRLESRDVPVQTAA